MSTTATPSSSSSSSSNNGSSGGAFPASLPSPSSLPSSPLLRSNQFNVKPPEVVLVESFMDSCAVTGVAATGIGFFAGGAFGLITAGMDPNVLGNPSSETPLKGKEVLRELGRRTSSFAKNFAVVGGLIATSECIIEKYRGKTDLYNSLGAGCVAGGLMGFRAGPQAAGLGCVGFAAFSAAMDYFLKHD